MNGISEQKQFELYKKFLIINRSDKKSNNNNHYQENLFKRNQNSFKMSLIEKSPPYKTQPINNIYNIRNNANNIQINSTNKKEICLTEINKPSFIKNKSNIIAKIRPIEIENIYTQKNKLVSSPNSINQLHKSTFSINKTINIEKLNNGHLTDRNMRINNLNLKDSKLEEFEEKNCKQLKGIYKKRMISSSDNLNKVEKYRIKDKIDIIPIPCMNCGNLVEIDKIEKHSLNCFKVSNNILYLELPNKETNNINYKLKKLNDYITNIEKEENSDNIKYLITVLKEYIEKVLKINKINNENIKELKNIYKNFTMLNNSKHSSLNFIILIDRARILVQEKIKIFKNIINKTEISKSPKSLSNNRSQQSEFETQINKKSKELEKINQEMQLEKIKVKNLRDSVFSKSSCFKIKNGLSTYNGNVINITNNRYNNKSLKNSNSSVEISLDNNSNGSFENSSYASTKSKKKLFFREVIRIKLEKLHNSHRGQKIPPAIIWENALKENIPENNWESFILHELNNPQKSENMIKGKSANYSRMSVINEE